MKPRVATWAEGEKAAIGTAIGEQSRVWFSIARGRLTEVFYPSPDRACIRSLGLTVLGHGFVADELHCIHEYARPRDDVPVAVVINRDPAGRFTIEKETLADPRSDVVLQRVRWRAAAPARLRCQLEPRLDNTGEANATAVLEHRGVRLLTAERAGVALALACTRPWAWCGVRDPDKPDDPDDPGPVVLIGDLELVDRDSFVLALAFAHTAHEAAHAALGSLARGYELARDEFVRQWQAWTAPIERRPGCRWWHHSAAVLKTLEAKRADGGRVAALSTPWGPRRGPGIEGTYHLAWTRDLVETMAGLVAAGVHDEARATLVFLCATQHPDGHWPQNMLLDGERVWRGEELDEAALPILLVDLLRRERALSDRELARAWGMVARAADHLIRTGPTTQLDRWEDTAGATPFTLATEISALLCAAEFAAARGVTRAAREYRDVAARWDAQIEPLLYRRGGALAARVGVDGYYVRARRPGQPFPELDLQSLPRTEVSPDALALVRFGLRDARDARIANTVRVIDAVLATDLGIGRIWRRYPNDEYGEYADGAPFDGHGIGRPWPLLVGERAHYELARGDLDRAIALQQVMERCASLTGMIPEQIWDGPDLPDRGLSHAGPTGSAAPLGWAHAEYVKLCRSIADRRVFDLPTARL